MTDTFGVLRQAHIALGIGGVLMMIFPLILAKGSVWHRRTGWAFVACMGGASASAIALAAMRLIEADRTGQLSLQSAVMPVFLTNVAMLTGASLWFGVRVLGQKGRTEAHRVAVDLAVPVCLIGVSVGVLVLGVMAKQAVLFTLPSVGIVLGVSHLWQLLRRPSDRMFWWFAHMAGMIGGCIAATTAALVVNSGRVQGTLSGYVTLPGWLLWVLPTIVGTAMIVVWSRKYRAKFNRARS